MKDLHPSRGSDGWCRSRVPGRDLLSLEDLDHEAGIYLYPKVSGSRSRDLSASKDLDHLRGV